MKTSSLKFLFISGVALLGLAAGAAAQDNSLSLPRPAGVPVGLLGANYVGAEFGYTHQVDGGPRVRRDYGFVYNTPLPEGLDFNFNYDYLTGSANGVTAKEQLAVVGLTAGAKRSCRAMSAGLGTRSVPPGKTVSPTP